MSKRSLLYIVIGWGVLIIIKYYLPFFMVTLLWIGLSFLLLSVLVIEFIKLIVEIIATIRTKKPLAKLRILKVLVFSTLLYLTFKPWILHGVIEKFDWKMFYAKRIEIVEKGKLGKLYPNGKNENGICKLPFKFPILSNGGNEISIYRNMEKQTVTVTFWVYRNFFSAPSTSFVYTNDPDGIKVLENEVKEDPENNWKIQDNWYRNFGE